MTAKRILVAGLSLALAVSSFVGTGINVKAEGEVPVYRLCNLGTNEHLYTTSQAEVKDLVATATWRDEGTGWIAPDSGVGVYRLYHRGIDDHLYTTDSHEVSVLTGQGWSLDNNGNPLFYSGGNTTVYRLNNDSTKRHLLTADSNENNTLIAGRSWVAESGINCLRRPANTTPAPQQTPTPQPTPQAPVMGTNTIENTTAKYAIEARMQLSGTGTGYHAKLVFGTPTSAVSFGIQCDSTAYDPYKNVPIYLVENIRSNAPGMQDYKRLGAASANPKVMLSAYADGNIVLYVDGNEIGRVHNPELANTDPTFTYVMCEASGRKLGDTVSATFSDVKIKKGGAYNPNATYYTNQIHSNRGISVNFPATVNGPCNGVISGTVLDIPAESDWDVNFDDVSGKVEFRD